MEADLPKAARPTTFAPWCDDYMGPRSAIPPAKPSLRSCPLGHRPTFSPVCKEYAEFTRPTNNFLASRRVRLAFIPDSLLSGPSTQTPVWSKYNLCTTCAKPSLPGCSPFCRNQVAPMSANIGPGAVKFVALDAIGLPVKRKQVAHACEACRRKKVW